MGSTVVRAQAWRRWALVLAVAVALCSVPVIVNVWPARAAAVDPATLRRRIAASAAQPYQGYAQSSGLLPLPSLPNLGQVTALVSGVTEMRTWYAGRDRWRVDVLGPGTERDTYQTRFAQYVWDFGDNQLTEIVGDQPIRLPRAPDLTPPELVRRILGIAAADRFAPIAAKRVAGRVAAGLRITPATADTTVAHVDVWADPASGLPLQAEITAKGGTRPVFTTRFLQVRLGAPDAGTLNPPTPTGRMGFTTTSAPDILSAINQRRFIVLPPALAGRARSSAIVPAAGAYGTGLGQFVVAALPGRFGSQAYEQVHTYGQAVTVPTGEAALIATGLLTVLVVRADRTYLVAGMVQPALLEQVAADLAEAGT